MAWGLLTRAFTAIVPRIAGAAGQVGRAVSTARPIAQVAPKVAQASRLAPEIGKIGKGVQGTTKIAEVAPKSGIVPKGKVGQQPLMSDSVENGRLLEAPIGKVAPKAPAPAAPAAPAKTAATEVGAVDKPAEIAGTGKAADVGKVGEAAMPVEEEKKGGGIMNTIGNISTVAGLGITALQIPNMLSGLKGGESGATAGASESASQQALSDPGYMPAYGSGAVAAPMMGGVTSPGGTTAGAAATPRYTAPPAAVPELLPPGVVAPTYNPLSGPHI